MPTQTQIQDVQAQHSAPAPADGDQFVTVADLQRLLAAAGRVLVVLPDGSADVYPEALAEARVDPVHASCWRSGAELADGQ